MPIFRINDQLHYFAHVPKCGGTSVESYLAERFGPLALRDLERFQLPPGKRWSQTSPQHIPAQVLHQFIPKDWLASSFAIVRHPVRRAISSFLYARDKNRHIPLATDFDTWFAEAAVWIPQELYRLDGHFASQSSFVPESARIFRLEDGLEQVVAYLDQLAGTDDGPRSVPTLNVGRWRAEATPPPPGAKSLALIQQVYAEDFARFGYATVPDTQSLASLPDLPTLASTGRPPLPRRRSFRHRILRALERRAGL
jgi:Sulfotransferase family